LEEIWKDIQGYGGRYQVSSFGNIRSFKTKKGIHFFKYLKPLLGTNGYYCIRLYGDVDITKTIHKLVARHFLGAIPTEKHTVNHINRDKLDNRVCNLEWMTYSENNLHSIGSRRNYSKEDIEKMIEYFNKGYTLSEIARIFKSSKGGVRKILSGESYLGIPRETIDFSKRIANNVLATREIILEIKKMRIAGVPNKDIREIFHISNSTIYRSVHRE
jgi:DNA-binding transcriptional MerR regulator